MADPFSHIEESFKNAFEHWEAPHSSAEMNAGWDQVANHLPQVPQTPATGNGVGHIVGGAGKIAWITGISAAVVAAVSVLYNIYVKPVKPSMNEDGNKPATEQSKPDLNTGSGQAENNSTSKTEKANTNQKPGQTNGGVLQLQDNNPKILPLTPFGSVASQGFGTLLSQNTLTNNSTVQPKPQSTKDKIQSMRLFLSDTLVCTGVSVSASSNISYPGVTIEWGDGNWNDFFGQNTHVYAHPGTFRAHLTIDSIRADRMITVLSTPKARFTVTKGEKLTCSFGNTSLNANRYSWNYGDEDGYEPGYYANHTYRDTGRYEVRLVAINSTGCTDTAVQLVNVRQFSEPSLTTNGITPNGDGKNDETGVNIEGETYFQFTIIDESGQKVFQTNDKNKHWGGQNQFTGSECKAGQYYYTITYSFNQNAAPKTKPGQITLIRSKN